MGGWAPESGWHILDLNRKVNILLFEFALAEETKTELVAAHDCVFVHRVVLCVQHFRAEVEHLV